MKGDSWWMYSRSSGLTIAPNLDVYPCARLRLELGKIIKRYMGKLF
jgi:MoaA/NifB/PqqE/SkfB family radical SAM enzyme